MNFRKEIIKFWKCSMIHDYSDFDFTMFFEKFQNILLKKLATHGMSSFKDYMKYIKKFYEMNRLEHFVYISEHTNAKWDIDDLITLIFKPRYLFFREKHVNNPKYEILQELYKDLIQWNSTKSLDDNIILVDKCIHAQHNSGNLLNLDIEELRKNVI